MRPTAFKERTGSSQSKKQQSQPAMPDGKTVVGKSPESKKAFPWKWVGIGAALFFCCAIAFLFVASRDQRNAGQATSVPVEATGTSDLPGITVTETGKPPEQPNVTPPLVDSPELQAAKDAVSQNPSDPEAHLNLALVLWDAGAERESAESLRQAADLAGPTNEAFFINAAEGFKKREAWVPAAGMYLRLVPIYRTKEIPEDLENDMIEAVYKSTESKEMPLYVFFERIENASLPLGYVARSRYALFNGTLEDAKTYLQNAKNTKSDMYEAFLLEAEINLKDGKTAEAKAIFISLSSDLGAPEWVRFMAEDYLKNMQ
jgi:hypothetical protein